MSHLHILVVFIFALLVGPAAGSAELNGGRSPSTRRALSLGPRCKFISLAELQALPFWQTFYDRLSVVIFGHIVEKTFFTSVGFKLRTTFEDGSQDAKVCSERVDFYNIGEPICYVTTTYTKEIASGDMTFDYPVGLSTVIGGTVAEVGSLTGGTIYETSAKNIYGKWGLSRHSGEQASTIRTRTTPSDRPTLFSRSFEVDANGEYETTVSSYATPGGICSLRYHNTTCIQEATGEAAFNLYGAVQVVFDSPVNKIYFWYLSLNDWVAWAQGGEPWSYSESQATITTTGNDNSLTAVECRYS
ncbi:hypothetical protein B0H16DRAFT_1732422 [Mycena metata]|uniref:Uncharacterized protein n=1 Tax=Mycena metata TaxID=1033252 RepID=A0AAD7I1P7_9AGAR|nr:hypothetical protein B0H16DRAFT_1732422 [Mycena metata]